MLGLDRGCASELCHGAADNGRDRERGESDPVLLLGDREAMQRLNLEEVEANGADCRSQQTQPPSPDDRDQQDPR